MKDPGDALLGTFLIGVAGVALWACQDYAFGTAFRMGPGYFPTYVSLLLAGFGVALIGRSFFRGERLQRWAWFALAALTTAIGAFALTFERFGLVVAVALLMAISSLAIPNRRWREVPILAFFSAVGAWLVFGVGLGLSFKIWPF